SINGYLGYNLSSGSNTVFLADTGSVWKVANSLNIGSGSGGNQVIVSNGATLTAHDIVIPGALNTLTIVGGGAILTGPLNGTPGTVVLSSGLLNASSLLLSPGSPSQLTFNGGTLQVRSSSAGSAPINVGNGSSPALFELLSSGTNTFPGGLILRS